MLFDNIIIVTVLFNNIVYVTLPIQLDLYLNYFVTHLYTSCSHCNKCAERINKRKRNNVFLTDGNHNYRIINNLSEYVGFRLIFINGFFKSDFGFPYQVG